MIPSIYFEVTKLKVNTLRIHCKPGIKRKCSLLKVDIPIDLMILRSQGQKSTTIFKFKKIMTNYFFVNPLHDSNLSVLSSAE